MNNVYDTVYDVIIIGGGPAGYTAALYCARANLSTLVLEKLSPGGQMGITDRIDNYPGFPEGIDGFQLAAQMKQGAERFGSKTLLVNVTAVSLQSDIKEIQTKKGTLRTRTVILASGAHPRKLGLDMETELTGRGVSYCATCDGMFYRDKTVAVVGGGNTAVSDVLYLSKLCKKIYLIHRRDTLRASRVYSVPLESADNVEILYNTTVEEILHDQKVTGIKIQDTVSKKTQELAVDGIFVAVGNIPNSELYQGQITLDEAGYIAADETTKTNIPGVFAIGDLRAKPLRQVVTATGDGAVASHFAEEYLSIMPQSQPQRDLTTC